jgi:hypothetical protein
MNQVLDVADSLGINVSLTPSPFENVGSLQYLKFLRRWYVSFGFKANPFTPALIYKAKK